MVTNTTTPKKSRAPVWIALASVLLVAGAGAVALIWKPWEPRHTMMVGGPAQSSPAVAQEHDAGVLSLPPAEVGPLSFALSEAVYASAPAVIVTGPAGLADAAETAASAVPLLVVSEVPTDDDLAAVTAEIERLGAAGAIPYGVELPESVPVVGGPMKHAAAPPVVALVEGEDEVTVVEQLLAPAGGTAVASGGDPRESAALVDELGANPETLVIRVGTENPDLAWQAATARTGVQLPGGGQLVDSGKMFVALYGHPAGPQLGVLGEQNVPRTIERAQQHAGWYDDLVDETVVPSLEIIATVASAGPEDDDTYSRKTPIEELRPLVDAAAESGTYVVLDLQPGRTDFLTQAKLYEELLLEPHVGLALDPEWRLKPDQVHLRQIGQVDTAEVNEVVAWLADLVRENNLPQKVLILHSFQNRMITNIDQLDTSRSSELAIVMHVDGQGGQGAKQGTWNTLRNYATTIDLWGWKNFYDEDTPAMLTPEQTVDNVNPLPMFVSYQ